MTFQRRGLLTLTLCLTGLWMCATQDTENLSIESRNIELTILDTGYQVPPAAVVNKMASHCYFNHFNSKWLMSLRVDFWNAKILDVIKTNLVEKKRRYCKVFLGESGTCSEDTKLYPPRVTKFRLRWTYAQDPDRRPSEQFQILSGWIQTGTSNFLPKSYSFSIASPSTQLYPVRPTRRQSMFINSSVCQNITNAISTLPGFASHLTMDFVSIGSNSTNLYIIRFAQGLQTYPLYNATFTNTTKFIRNDIANQVTDWIIRRTIGTKLVPLSIWQKLEKVITGWLCKRNIKASNPDFQPEYAYPKNGANISFNGNMERMVSYCEYNSTRMMYYDYGYYGQRQQYVYLSDPIRWSNLSIPLATVY